MFGWLRKTRTDPSSRARRQLGIRGEKLAMKYFKKQGYRVIRKNYRLRQGEIDLIMRQGRTLVFIEVKTRASEDYVATEKIVHYAKQKHIIDTAKYFIHKYNLSDHPCRFDVLAIVVQSQGEPVIHHYPNAFRPTH